MSLRRVILHWTAGGNRASSIDKAHYHFIVESDGTVVPGAHAPEANIRPVSGKYAAHTLNCNTGSIGVSMAGMLGAVERPFNAGKAPLTQAQVQAAAALVARLCCKYGIAVSRETVLSHAEVQPTLKIAQRGKWDVAWLPGMPATGDPVRVGDLFRGMVSEAMGARK